MLLRGHGHKKADVTVFCLKCGDNIEYETFA